MAEQLRLNELVKKVDKIIARAWTASFCDWMLSTPERKNTEYVVWVMDMHLVCGDSYYM